MIRRMATAMGLAACLACTGCDGSGSGKPRPGAGPVASNPGGVSPLPVHVETTRGGHVVVFRAPSAGWGITLDDVRATDEATQVYITVTSPDPSYLYTQQQVEQRIGTDVRAQVPVRVFVRTVPFGGGGPRSYEYSAASGG